MKFFFSLFFLCGMAHAEVILLSHPQNSLNASLAKKILQEKFFIPHNLISEEIRDSCEKNEAAVIHLCFDQADEMKILYVNQKVMKEVLGVFYEESK